MWWNTKHTDAMRRVLVARERIARRNPFFASLLFNARLEESDRRPAIWTNGINIFFNPKYVKENDAYIEGDVLEVIMHLALAHVPRRKSREKNKWNQATDLSVRPLVHQYFQQHPDLMKGDGLFPNKAAEEIYELLDAQEQKSGKGKGKGEGDGADRPGGMEDPSPEDQEEADQSAKDWARTVANATDKAQKAGNMPANILRLVEELLPVEKIDWRDITRDMSRDAKSKSSRSWSRVNRRRSGQDGDPIMPGYADDNIYNLIIAFDVSGSVSDEMLKAMKTEVAALLDQDLVNQATLIAVDTEPKSIEVVTNSQGVIDWKPRGGGGTHFESAMKLINEEYAGSIGMLFLTDLETGSFGKEPPFPIVYVNFGSNHSLKAPFGRTVLY